MTDLCKTTNMPQNGWVCAWESCERCSRERVLIQEFMRKIIEATPSRKNSIFKLPDMADAKRT